LKACAPVFTPNPALARQRDEFLCFTTADPLDSLKQIRPAIQPASGWIHFFKKLIDMPASHTRICIQLTELPLYVVNKLVDKL
jgi:hypothetical protein